MTDEKKLSFCAGCRNNFYNGHNDYGVKRCWSLESMEIIKRKRVHINQMPPFTQKPEKMASCYHEPQYVFLNCEEKDRQF